MKIHHLNCGTFRPWGGRLINRTPAISTCHVFLIETDQGLVMVDTGIGTADMKDLRRIGPMRFLLNTQKKQEDTALSQVSCLGYDPGEVTHIILTHMDLDHTGGLPDFPKAAIHVLKAEIDAAMKPRSFREKERYRRCHFAHGPKWAVHENLSGDPWFGFDAIREQKGLPEGIVLVPLAGHTKGHMGVAIQTGASSWLLHAGDAYYYDKQMQNPPSVTVGMKAFELFAHMDRDKAIAKKNRLWELVNSHKDEIRICSTHDPTEFEALSGTIL